MNNGYNPEQFNNQYEQDTVGDMNQLISGGKQMVNGGKSVVQGAKGAINTGRNAFNKLKKNDQKDVDAINNRGNNNDAVDKNKRRKNNNDDDSEDKKNDEKQNNNKQKNNDNKQENKSSSEKQTKENGINDIKKDDKEKDNVNEKVDKSKSDSKSDLDKNNKDKSDSKDKSDDKDKKNKNTKGKSGNKSSNVELEISKKKKKIKIILTVVKIAAIIALPIIIIFIILISVAAAIAWVKDNIPGGEYFYEFIVPEDLDITSGFIDMSKRGSNGKGQFSTISTMMFDAPIKVRLYNNDFSLVYSDDRLIDFDKYILGVAYQEVGGANEQTFKTQAIAARSYALTRGSKMGGKLSMTKENGYYVINIRQTTSDQAYCDPDEGYKSSGMLSNCSSSHGIIPDDDDRRVWAQEVNNLVLADSNGNVVYTPYVSTDQNAWASMANNGKNYEEILLSHYDSANNGYTISKIGTDNKSWKQGDSRWSSKLLYDKTIGKVGCAVTSVAIQISRSGVSTNVNGAFNPGTFVDALKANGMFANSNSIGWANVSSVANDFKLVSGTNPLATITGTQSEKANKLRNYLNNNEYVVLGVRYGVGKDIGHYVALNYVSGNDVYVFDPNSSKSGNLFADYPAMKNKNVSMQVVRYKVSK